jgi:hypothetical protein
LLEVARALPVAPTSEETAPQTRGIAVATWAEELARAAAQPATTVARGADVPAAQLRREVAALLGRLARRVDDALAAALARAVWAWEQVDALTMIDAELEGQISSARRGLAGAAHATAPAAQRAVALEGLLAVDAAVALARLCERRMAALLRLRMRSPAASELMPAGRPFLDLGAALHEAAEAWR